MIKSKLDLKLINIVLVCLILYLIYQTKNLWINILNKITSMIFPLFLSFIIAYTFYPILKFLEKHKIPKIFGIFLVLLLIFILIITIISLLIPILSNQGINLINDLIMFIQNITIQFNNNFLNELINKLGNYISTGFFKTINLSINFLTNLFITLSLSIYLLLDMDKIRDNIKKYLKEKSNKLYKYFKLIDNEMKKYLIGVSKISIISFFEYFLIYYLFSHPHALLLGILAAISNFIPYFGGLIVQIISVITALVISPILGLKITIVTLILGLIDNYVINPLVYGKTNQLHPILVILSVFIGGILFNFFGVIISLPISIIIINSIKFYKEKKY